MKAEPGKKVGFAAQLTGRLKAFIRHEDGPTATEYAVILALIIMTAIGAISTLGRGLSSWYVDIQSTLFA
jgi:pilus assembly protein Flp/PilA